MVKIRDNTVFIISDAIESAEYVRNSLIATKGQPTEEPVTVNVHEGVVTILARSGRKKSAPVANEFMNRCGGRALATQGGESGRPSELNFCFDVLLTFKDGTTATVTLGQGNRLAVRNNWWIGSKSMSGRTINGLNISPSSLKSEGADAGQFLKGIVPDKFAGLVDTLNSALLKDLINEVNVFKLD